MISQQFSKDSLIPRLQESLPFHAFVTKHVFIASASPDKLPVHNKQRIKITNVLDGGHEGGILCVAEINGGKEVLGISITHLRLEMRHPLYKEVRAYQIDRTKRLAIARMFPTGRQSEDRRTSNMGR